MMTYYLIVRHGLRKNRTIKIGSEQKNFGLSSNLVSSQWSLKNRNSQRTYAEVRVIRTAFSYPSIVLQPIRLIKHA